jgi:hypothetical protein
MAWVPEREVERRDPRFVAWQREQVFKGVALAD